jgi:two-component sensor histidine kinase
LAPDHCSTYFAPYVLFLSFSVPLLSLRTTPSSTYSETGHKSRVNIKSYLNDLGANISRIHSNPASNIQLELAVEDEYLNLDTAILVGLILKELLTNAYKYAFSEGILGK